jgi:carbonic anhydrase
VSRASSPSCWQQQTPQYLWIGCADSRVPANELVACCRVSCSCTATWPTWWCPLDLNALSVIQYAVDHCRCATSSWSATPTAAACARRCATCAPGLVDNWLRHVQDVRDRT